MEVKLLQMDDLKVGDYVTVIQGRRYKPYGGYTPSAEGFGSITITEMTEDKSYIGDLLEIMSYDLPFALLRNHNGCLGDNHRITLDLKEWKLKKLSKDFVEAKLSALKKEKEKEKP